MFECLGRIVATVATVAAVASDGRTPAQLPIDPVGITGSVLAPDGTPAAEGTVDLIGGFRLTTPIVDGRFRLVPDTGGARDLLVTLPGHAPHRTTLVIPPSRTMRLPAIRVAPPTFARVRFMAADGTPIAEPHVRRVSVDARGRPLAEPAGYRVQFETDGEGITTIGPLPRGVTTLVLDTVPYAQLRLPDLRITGRDALVDVGTVRVPAGARLFVDVVDGAGAPVQAQEVFLEEVAPLPVVFFRPSLTDDGGRAIFDRLGAGRYRVRTRAGGLCGNRPLAAARMVTVSGSGESHVRVVTSGTAAFALASPLGPLRGIALSASPDEGSAVSGFPPSSASGPAPSVFRLGRVATPCDGRTDATGRAALAVFPPGPAVLEVQLHDSTYVRRVTIPEQESEIPVDVPDGFLSVRVRDARTNEPVRGARIAWTAKGGRVQAVSSATGEALLEAVGASSGTLSVAAAGYESHEEKLAEPPGMLHEVTLEILPPSRVEARVITPTGDPLPGAAVELVLDDPLEPSRIAAADEAGAVVFPDVPVSALRLTATLDGRSSQAVRIPRNVRRGVVLTLDRSPR